jgi:hypothetical protein
LGWNDPPAISHWAAVAWKHPLGVQHAPVVVVGQLVAVHTVPLPR